MGSQYGFIGCSKKDHFQEKDLDREFLLPPTTFIGGDRTHMTLREIVARLKSIYCNHTGVEYMVKKSMAKKS